MLTVGQRLSIWWFIGLSVHVLQNSTVYQGKLSSETQQSSTSGNTHGHISKHLCAHAYRTMHRSPATGLVGAPGERACGFGPDWWVCCRRRKTLGSRHRCRCRSSPVYSQYQHACPYHAPVSSMTSHIVQDTIYTCIHSLYHY